MGIDLYYVPESSPCRAVLLAAKALGVDLNKKLVDLANEEHLKPEFLKMNPQHTVPTMVHNGFAITESRAAMTYLANKYGKDNSLYPKDPQARALVDQRLFFDIGTLYQAYGDYDFPQIFAKAPADPAKLERLHTALGFFDTFLEGQTWAAGKNLTLADLTLVASISTMEIAGIDISKYANVLRWYANCKKNVAGYDELNESGVQAYKAMIQYHKNL